MLKAWGETLIATSPRMVCRSLGLSSGVVIIVEDDDTLRVASRRAGAMDVRHDRVGRSDVLRGEIVPAEADVLRRTLTVPSGALGEIDNLIRFDLPVSTPFDPDEVIYAARIAGRAGDEWQVHVAILPKSRLQILVERIQARFQSVPGRISFGAGLACPADPAQSKAARDASRLDLALCGLAATLALLAWMLAQQQVDGRTRMLQNALSERMSELDRASAIKASIERYEKQAEFIIAEGSRRPSTRAMLAVVAQALEPATRLDSMTWSGDALTLRPRPGSAAIGDAATTLIGDRLFPSGYSTAADPETRSVSFKMAGKASK
jgi:hypothetical protein